MTHPIRRHVVFLPPTQTPDERRLARFSRSVEPAAVAAVLAKHFGKVEVAPWSRTDEAHFFVTAKDGRRLTYVVNVRGSLFDSPSDGGPVVATAQRTTAQVYAAAKQGAPAVPADLPVPLTEPNALALRWRDGVWTVERMQDEAKVTAQNVSTTAMDVFNAEQPLDDGFGLENPRAKGQPQGLVTQAEMRRLVEAAKPFGRLTQAGRAALEDLRKRARVAPQSLHGDEFTITGTRPQDVPGESYPRLAWKFDAGAATEFLNGIAGGEFVFTADARRVLDAALAGR